MYLGFVHSGINCENVLNCAMLTGEGYSYRIVSHVYYIWTRKNKNMPILAEFPKLCICYLKWQNE